MTSLCEGVRQDPETHIALRDAFLILMGERPMKTLQGNDPTLDKDGWPKRWSDSTYLGDGPWGA